MTLADMLAPRSSLTRKQADYLVSYVRVLSHEIRLREAAWAVEGGPVTVGSYYRTISQGRKNIRESVATIAIALTLGLVEFADLNRLMQLVASGPTDFSALDEQHLGEVLIAILDKLVR